MNCTFFYMYYPIPMDNHPLGPHTPHIEQCHPPTSPHTEQHHPSRTAHRAAPPPPHLTPSEQRAQLRENGHAAERGSG